MSWRFEWIQQWPQVWDGKFHSAWRHIQASSAVGHVYHRPDLVRAWAETRGRAVEAEPMVGLATDEVGRRVLMPWVVVAYAGRFTRRRVLEQAGQSLFAYQDPLVDGHEADTIDWPAFWEAARRATAGACDQALFRFVRPSYGRGARSELSHESSPVLELSGLTSLEALLARCAASHRGDVRRLFRRLDEQGEVTLWVPGPRETAAALEDFSERFLPVFHGLWRGRPEGDFLDEPGMADFASRVIGEGLPAGWAQYVVLRVAGAPVSWHLGFVHQEELYWWLPTFDPAWKTLSPGKVLLARLIELAIERGWRRVHFLTGSQPYKLAWGPELPELRIVRWHAPTVAGRILACYDALKESGLAEAARG